MRTILKVLVGLALSALTLYLFLRSLDFAAVRSGLASSSPTLLALAIVVGYFGHLTARSFRWAVMLAPLKSRIGFYNLFSTTAIGYLVSWLAPGRLGEVVRPVLLARREDLPAGACVATIAVERLLDSATILALAAGAALSAPLWWSTPGGSVSVRIPGFGDVDLLKAAPWLGGVGLLGCVAVYLVLRSQLREESALLRLLQRGESGSSGLRRKLWGFGRTLMAGASFLGDGRRAALVGLQSLVLWATVGVGIWIGLVAAGVRIPFPGVFLLLLAATVGIAVPTPGGFGPVQLLFQKTLIGLFGIEPTHATVATVVYHPILVYIPPVIFGLLFAWRDGLTLSGLRTMARQDAAKNPDSPASAQNRASADRPDSAQSRVGPSHADSSRIRPPEDLTQSENSP